MSISAVGSSSVYDTTLGQGQQTNSVFNTGASSDEIAASILDKDDADGDGLLSLEETPLDEERFSAIDTDGDGFISAEELSADAQARQAERDSFMNQLGVQMQGTDTESMVSSIFANDDADGDGLLSLNETPLDEERFNSIDTDGDGYISTDELTTDMEANMAEGASAPPPGSEAQAAGSSGSASGSGESEEEYDEYDLNEDGTVSLDELMQAYNSGDTSLETLFKSMGESFMSSLTQRYAMEAYQAQMA